MRAILITQIKYLGYSYPECFHIHNTKISKIDSSKANSLIEKYNLTNDFSSPLGTIYVDSTFKESAQPIKEKLIRQLEILE